MNNATIARYANDPGAFQSDLILPSAIGVHRFGSIMHDFQRARFEHINPALLSLAADKKPACGRFLWEGAKGTSKDSDAAILVLWLLAFSRRRLAIQIGACDQDQASEPRKIMEEIIAANPWLAARIVVDRFRIYCPATKSECEIVPADNYGSHGARPDFLLLNELSHIQKDVYAANLVDNASKRPHGVVLLMTNAGTLGSWQHKWRELARQDPDRWCFEQWAKPSPWLDPAEVESAKRRNTSERFLRLFYGVWSSASGDALDPEAIQSAIVLPGPMYRGPDGWTFVAGLDLGISRDHAALVTLGVQHGTNRITLADCRSWKPTTGRDIDLATVERAVVDVHNRFRLRALWFDPFQAMYLSQNLSRRGIRVEKMVFSGRSLDMMASTILEVFNAGMLDLFDEPDLIRDLSRLNIVEKAYGYKLESVRDADGHADRATALAIVLPAAMKLASDRAYAGLSVPQRFSRGITASLAAAVQLSRN